MEFKYTLTIIEACRSKSPEKVIKVVDEMIELGYSLEEIIYYAIIYGFCKYASSTEARRVFSVMKDRNIISEANFIVYEDTLNEHLKKVTADLVISGLKFFDLESKLKWRNRIDWKIFVQLLVIWKIHTWTRLSEAAYWRYWLASGGSSIEDTEGWAWSLYVFTSLLLTCRSSFPAQNVDYTIATVKVYKFSKGQWWQCRWMNLSL